MERKSLQSFAVIAMTAAALVLAVPGNAQGRRPSGGGMGGNRPSSSQSSSPRSSSPSMSSSPRSSSPSVSSSPRSSSPSVSSSPRSSSPSVSRPSSPVSNRPSTQSVSTRPSTPSVGSRPSTQVNNNRPSSPVSNSRTTSSPSMNTRPSGNGGFHGGNDNGGNRPSTGGRTNFGRDNARTSVGTPTVSGSGVNNARPSDQFNRNTTRPGGNPGGNHGGNPGGNPGGKPGGNMGGGNQGGNHGGNNGGNYRPGGNNRPGGNHGGNYRPGGNNRPGGNVGHRPPANHGINHGGPRPDYNRYRWHDSFRPRGPRDRWYDYYRYNRWSWRYPIAPPLRPWRPRVIWYYRPIIPAGYRIYASAPLITGVLGLEFGTLLDASLNYLYYNGYSIDGYQDNVVYLRDVNMMGYSWPDVMLQYNDGGGLCYAEFVTSSSYQDNYRFNDIYSSLCATYGTPINSGNGYYSWYGGSQTGFINLNFAYDNGRYYTVMTLGA